jgi:hypothetical protein
MGKYKDLRNELVTVLSGVQLSDAPAFKEIVTAPKEKFAGIPAATVVPASVESDVYSVGENLRAYGFDIYLHYPIENGDTWADSIDVMLELVDAVLDALDTTIDLSGVADLLEAAPMAWDLAMAGEQLQIIATIHTIAKVSVSV